MYIRLRTRNILSLSHDKYIHKTPVNNISMTRDVIGWVSTSIRPQICMNKRHTLMKRDVNI